jgi:hypothetical protein
MEVRALIVDARHEPESFCSARFRRAAETLSASCAIAKNS